jgi:hypothetical protein
MRPPLQRLRDYYLECFAESIEKARGRFDQLATELLLGNGETGETGTFLILFNKNN